MIYRARDSKDENGQEIKPSEKWFGLAASAKEVALREKSNHIANDQVYGHREVRMALERLFYDKCAYCESPMTASGDWDVEHYRPKGRVAERGDHPGYYWLAYSWENLYPVCTHCNQGRKDKPRWNERSEGASAGKLDQFPLENENLRAMSHTDNVQQELPLLIAPCCADPEQSLGFDVKGQIFALDDNKRGVKTIDICHLKRKRLRDARLRRILAAIEVMQTMRKFTDQGNLAAVEDCRGILDNHIVADHCPYAAAARAVMRDPEAFGI